MLRQYLNKTVNESYNPNLITTIKSATRKAGFLTLVAAIIGAGYGCKKQEHTILV